MVVAVGTKATPVKWVELRDWGYGDDLNNLIDSTLVDDFADASLFEYEDAQLANHLRESEAYNDAIHEAQINAAAKSLGTFTPFAGQAMKNEFDRLHQMEESDSDELERMAEYHHWSHDSYTEEYNP